MKFVVLTKHQHSASARTAPTQYECGPHSKLIFQTHYHSQRHTNFLKIGHFRRIFWKFPNLLKKFDSQKLVNLSMSLDIELINWGFFPNFYLNFLGGSAGARLESLITKGHSAGTGEHSKILGNLFLYNCNLYLYLFIWRSLKIYVFAINPYPSILNHVKY